MSQQSVEEVYGSVMALIPPAHYVAQTVPQAGLVMVGFAAVVYGVVINNAQASASNVTLLDGMDANGALAAAFRCGSSQPTMSLTCAQGVAFKNAVFATNSLVNSVTVTIWYLRIGSDGTLY